MLRKKVKTMAALSAAIAAVGLPGVRVVRADTLNWDPAKSGATSPSGGSGTWDLSSTLWWDALANGGAGGDVAWVNAGQNAGTTDDAVFGATGGTVTIGSTITANSVTFNPTTGAYTLTGTAANVLTLSGANPGIVNLAGLNTVSARVVGVGSLNTIAGGSMLTLSNTNTGGNANNFIGASFNVASGGTLRANVSTVGNNLAGAAITLNGGTLSLVPSATAAAGGLFGRWLTGQSGNVDTVGFTNTAAATNVVAVTAGGTQSTSITQAGDFYGKLNVTTAGTYTFGLNVDDGARLFIDGQLVVNNDTGAGKGVGTTLTGPGITLSAGLHDVRLQYINTGGNGSFTISSSTAVTAATLFLPEVTGTAFVALPNAEQMNNSLNVAAGTTSAVDFGTNTAFVGIYLAPTAGTGLTLGAGSTLNVTGLAGKQFGAASTAFSGTVTINATPDVYAGNLSDGGTAGRLIHQGAGQLFIDSFGQTGTMTAGTVIEMQGGRLHVYSSATNATGAGNPLGLSSVTLNGGGMILDTRQGSSANGVFVNNAINVLQSASIQDYNDTLTTVIGSATNSLSIAAGATLTLDAITGTQSGTGNAPGATLRVDSAISGGGNIVIMSSSFGATTFPGTIFLNNANPNFTGSITVNAGLLSGGGSAAASITPFGTNTVLINNTSAASVSQLNLRANGTGNNGTIFVGGSNAANAQKIVFTSGSNAITLDVNNNGGNTGNTFQLNTLTYAGPQINVTGANGYGIAFSGTTGVSQNLTINPTSGNLTLGGLNDFGTPRTLTKTGTGTATLNQTAVSFSGSATVSAGTLVLSGSNALGAGPVNVVSTGVLTLATTNAVSSGVITETGNTVNYNATNAAGAATINVNATQYGNGFLFMNGAIGNGGGHINMGTASTIIINANTATGLIRASSTAFADGNIYLSGGTGATVATIVDEAAAGANNKIQNLGVGNDLWFGLNANVTDTVTVGTTDGTTPWKGITGDFGSVRRTLSGTINAASDFYLKSFVNINGTINGSNTLGISSNIFATTTNAVNAILDGSTSTSVILGPAQISPNVTFQIQNNANLTLTGSNTFGSGSNVAAGVVVQRGGTIDPGPTGSNQTTINTNVLVQAGGRLLLNDQFNIAGTQVGNITLQTGAVVDINGTNGQFALLTSGAASTNNTALTTQLNVGSGVIVRMGANDIAGLSSASGAGNGGVFGPDANYVVGNGTTQVTLTFLNSGAQGTISGNGTNFSGYLTNDAVSRAFGNTNQTITVGGNGAGFAASTGTIFTINPQIDATSGGLVTFGAGNSLIDGLSKFGTLVFNGQFVGTTNVTFTGGTVVFAGGQSGVYDGTQIDQFTDVTFNGGAQFDRGLLADSITINPLYTNGALVFNNANTPVTIKANTVAGGAGGSNDGVIAFGIGATASASVVFNGSNGAVQAMLTDPANANLSRVVLGQFSEADLNLQTNLTSGSSTRLDVWTPFLVQGGTNSVAGSGRKFQVVSLNGSANTGVNLNNVTLDGGVISVDSRAGTTNATDVRIGLNLTANGGTVGLVGANTGGFGLLNVTGPTNGTIAVLNAGVSTNVTISGVAGVRMSGTTGAPTGNSLKIYGTVASGVEIDTQNGTIDFVADAANGLAPVLNGVVDVTKVNNTAGDSFVRIFAGSDGSANGLTGSGRFNLGTSIATTAGTGGGPEDMVTYADRSTTGSSILNVMPVRIDVKGPAFNGASAILDAGTTAATAANTGAFGTVYYQANGTNGGVHLTDGSVLRLQIFDQTNATVTNGANLQLDAFLDGNATLQNQSGNNGNITLNKLVEVNNGQQQSLTISGNALINGVPQQANLTFTNTAGNGFFLAPISGGTLTLQPTQTVTAQVVGTALVPSTGTTLTGGGTAIFSGNIVAQSMSFQGNLGVLNPSSTNAINISATNSAGIGGSATNNAGQIVVGQPGVFGTTQNNSATRAWLAFGASFTTNNGAETGTANANVNALLQAPGNALAPNGIVVGNQGVLGFTLDPTTSRYQINQLIIVNGNTPQNANFGTFDVNRSNVTNTVGNIPILIDFNNVQLMNGSGFAIDESAGSAGGTVPRVNLSLAQGATAYVSQNDTMELLGVGLVGNAGTAQLNFGVNTTSGGISGINGVVTNGVTINLVRSAGFTFKDPSSGSNAGTIATGGNLQGTLETRFNVTTGQTIVVQNGRTGTGFGTTGGLINLGGTATAILQALVNQASGTAATAALVNTINPEIDVYANGTAGANAATLSGSIGSTNTGAFGLAYFPNVHLKDNATLTLAPTNSAYVLANFSLDGSSAKVGANYDVSGTTYANIGSIAGPAAGSAVLTVNDFAGTKGINLVGPLSSNVTVQVNETSGNGMTVTNFSRGSIASNFALNGGTLQITGGKASVLAGVNPGTNGTFLFTGGTTTTAVSLAANVIYAPTATSTAALTFNAAQNLQSLTVGNGTTPATLTNNNQTLSIAGPLTLAKSATLTLTSGTQLASVAALNGSGVLAANANDITMPFGSHVSLDGVPDLLTVNLASGAKFKMSAGSTLDVDVVASPTAGTASAGVSYDTLTVNSIVDLSGLPTLAVHDAGYTSSTGIGDKLFIVNNTSASAVVGQFNGYADGSTVVGDSGALYRISYTGDFLTQSDTPGTGNDVVLTTLTPEPSSAVILLGLSTAGLMTRRRRRRD